MYELIQCLVHLFKHKLNIEQHTIHEYFISARNESTPTRRCRCPKQSRTPHMHILDEREEWFNSYTTLPMFNTLYACISRFLTFVLLVDFGNSHFLFNNKLNKQLFSRNGSTPTRRCRCLSIYDCMNRYTISLVSIYCLTKPF